MSGDRFGVCRRFHAVPAKCSGIQNMAAGQTEVLILAERTDVNVTFGMDKNLKLELERLLSKLGLDITEYFTMAARQAVIEQGIPFKVTMEIPNAETRQAMQDTLDGKGLSRVYSSCGEMMRDIDAGD